MVVLRLMRAGAKKRPFYRVVAADSRRQRDGRFLEILGHYNPIAQPHELMLHKDKIEVWLAKGAQPSVQVASLIRSAGIAIHAPKQAAAVADGAEKPKAVKKAAAKSAKKAAGKRAAPRKPSERKTRAKAARSKKKAAKKA